MGKGAVLVHNRGRLKYERPFVRMLQHLAGSEFPLEIEAQDGRILPFSDLAGFTAVVILPYSPESCMLRHLFKMRVPLFVPDRALLQNLVHVYNQRLLPYPYHLPAPGTDRDRMQALHRYDPFLDTVRGHADATGIAARAYWAEYSEYLMMPALEHFVSPAALLVDLHSTATETGKAAKISSRMRAAYLSDLGEAQSFWLEALVRLTARRNG